MINRTKNNNYNMNNFGNNDWKGHNKQMKYNIRVILSE